ncbi:MAG: isocitrate lyase/phosphoenolpyruvate mutase family protein [Nocardioides sp.]|uniref:isocitrate lyase/PEP mutase family protein n=1 Tax=Nocardioides sp. TaxID=35761 RepID=UPI0039E5C19C
MSTVIDSPGRRFRAELAAHTPLLLPGVHDALSARVLRRSGARVGYLSGSATAMATLAAPDIGLLSGTELIDQARRITTATDLALICDADTGFGNAVNVAHTVRALESAGAAGLQLEDQTFPKRCGHFDGKSVVSSEEMVQKIYAAAEARSDEDTVIIARTDAAAEHGIDEAIRRGRLYAAAGADVIFVEAPAGIEDLRRIPAAIGAPTLVNVVEGGRTPQLDLDEYGAMGFDIVLYPTAAVRAVAAALEGLYGHLLGHGTTAGGPVELVAFARRNEITGFAGFEELAARVSARAHDHLADHPDLNPGAQRD